MARRQPARNSGKAVTSPTIVHDVGEAEGQGLGFERIVFFSDAVFAIAITLLALEIKVGEIPDALIDAELPQRLLALWPQVLGYALGFSVIGAYWLAHHRLFAYIKRFDQRLMWLNLIFLALIAISPFPSTVIGEYGFHQSAQIFYALAVAVTGLAKEVLWWYASYHHRLLDPTLDPQVIRQVSWRGLIVPAVFLLSIPATWLGPAIPIVMWVLTPFVASLLVRRQ